MTRAKSSRISIEATGGRTVKHLVGRGLTYLPPWLMWLSLPGIALVLWLMAMPGRVAAMLVAIAITLAASGLSVFTHHAFGRRDPSVQIHATAFVAGCGAWVLAACVFGLFKDPGVGIWPEVWRIFSWLFHAFNWPIWCVWLIAGVAGCLTWSIRRVSTPAEAQGASESRLEKVLAGARVHKPKEIDGRVVAELEVNRGEQTVKDLQGVADKMAGALGVRPGAVRIAGNPKDAGRAELVIVPNDPLEQSTAWPGPSNPGGSIHDPVPVGVYEDGQVAQLWLTGDDAAGRALAHWLIMGMTRAGKSQGWTMAMADALTRRDVVVWASDHVKGSQTLRPIEPALDWVVKTQKGGREMIAATRDVVRARANDLGERGFDQWTPDCGLPLLVVWLEEAVELVSDSTSFVRLVQQAGSTGVVVVVSLQRASHDNIDTSARAQLAGTLCFGVRDGQDAAFALDDGVLDAGASPDLWQNRMPGYCYLVAPGVPDDRWAVPLRTYRASREQVAKAIAESADVRAVLDPLSRDAAGAPYARREIVLSSTDSLEGEVVDREQVETDDESGMEPVPPTLEPELNVDPDQPIGPPPDGANLEFSPASGPKLSTAEARSVVQQHLRTLVERGQTHTQPRDVCEMKPATTRTREWVRKELIRLCTEAQPGEIALERDVADALGVFRILTPVDAGTR